MQIFFRISRYGFRIFSETMLFLLQNFEIFCSEFEEVADEDSFFYLGILSERMMGRVQTLCDGYFSISVARHFITIYFTLKNIKYKNIYIRLVVNFGPFLFNYGLRHFERYFLKLFPNFSCNFVASYFTLNRRLNDIKQ